MEKIEHLDSFSVTDRVKEQTLHFKAQLVLDRENKYVKFIFKRKDFFRRVRKILKET